MIDEGAHSRMNRKRDEKWIGKEGAILLSDREEGRILSVLKAKIDGVTEMLKQEVPHIRERSRASGESRVKVAPKTKMNKSGKALVVGGRRRQAEKRQRRR